MPVTQDPAAARPQSDPEPEKVPEAPRKQVRPVTFLLAPLVLFLLIDVVVFRSNFYLRFIEPVSSQGMFEAMFEHESARARGPSQVIVFGASRIAEGFSAKSVNTLEPKGGYFFINGAVAGTTPRCMYYLIRDLDPDRNRYKALVLTIDDYNDPDDYEDFADRIDDLHRVVARLTLADVFPFMQSFTTPKIKWEVMSGSLLKTLPYQRDLQEFMDHPSVRLDKVKLYRDHFSDWAYDYGGSDHSLAGTTIDWATETITFPPNIAKPEQDNLRLHMIINAPQDGHVRAYQIRWFSAIADLYRNSKTRIIFIQAPRTPLPRPVPLKKWEYTSADILAKRSWVTVLDHRTFETLERPELFSDYAHLNSEGRKQFSPALATAIKTTLGQVRQ